MLLYGRDLHSERQFRILCQNWSSNMVEILIWRLQFRILDQKVRQPGRIFILASGRVASQQLSNECNPCLPSLPPNRFYACVWICVAPSCCFCPIFLVLYIPMSQYPMHLRSYSIILPPLSLILIHFLLDDVDDDDGGACGDHDGHDDVVDDDKLDNDDCDDDDDHHFSSIFSISSHVGRSTTCICVAILALICYCLCASPRPRHLLCLASMCR